MILISWEQGGGKHCRKKGGAWLYAMVIGERGREVILIEAQFATLPLKSFQGTLEKSPCWPMGVFWSYSGFSVNELAAGRGAGVIGG